MTTENTPRRGPASPLWEIVTQWRLSQQGTVEDFQELDRILTENRDEDTALAYIAARVCQEDVPLHVAADIDQLIWEQSHMVVEREFFVADERGWTIHALGEFDSLEDAAMRVADGRGAKVLTRITVESEVFVRTAHVDGNPAAAGA